jgi:hypothetical protein
VKQQFYFRIGLIKPVKALIVGRTIKASDKAWREAIFGFGGTRKRLGGVKLGTVDGQPLAMIVELQTAKFDRLPAGAPWVIRGEKRMYALLGPAAVFNDAGFGPATLGISIDRLKELVTFDPDAETLGEALRQTHELEDTDDDGRKLI